jgi:hypothetical protein
MSQLTSSSTRALDFEKRLISPSREKLADLHREKADAHALLSDVSKDLREANEEFQAAMSARELVDHQLRHSDLQHLENSIAAADARIQKATLERDRLKEIVDRRSAKWSSTGQLIDAIERWLINVFGKSAAASLPLHTVSQSSGKRRESDNPFNVVEARRRRIRELRADVEKIAAAPIPSEDAKKIAHRQIADLAQRGRPDCFRLIEAGEEIKWPSVPHGQVRSLDDKMFSMPLDVDPPDGIAFFAWLHQDQMVIAIEREIDSSSDDANALTGVERQKQRTTALADILANERDEEDAIMAARTNGVDILRRIDADPRAVLGLASELPAPK